MQLFDYKIFPPKKKVYVYLKTYTQTIDIIHNIKKKCGKISKCPSTHELVSCCTFIQLNTTYN